jgi:hypothetical protein
MATATKLGMVQGKIESKRPVREIPDVAKSAGRTPGGSPLTAELKGFIDRVIVPILVRDYLSGVAQEKQIAGDGKGVASCGSMVTPNVESAR